MNENINTGNMAITTAAASAAPGPRTLEMVAAEIRTFTASMLNNIIEIGRRMCEAKDMLPYGKFGEWIKENTGYSRSTANNFMRVYLEYGTMQGSLFGATVEDDQTFGKLSYTQALALLALPSGEREEFVETHDVENMSTRELQNAIAERDAAIKRAKKAEESQEFLEKQMRTAREERDDAINRLREAEEAATAEVQPDQEAIDKAVAKAVEKANAANAEALREVKKRDKEKRDKLDKQMKDLRAKLAVAEAGGSSADADALKTEVEDLRKKLALSGEATVTFKVYFAAWQNAYANMMDALEQADEETAGRLRAAIRAQIGGWTNAEDVSN